MSGVPDNDDLSIQEPWQTDQPIQSWTRGVVYGFDLETTGVSVHDDRVVTATVVKIVDGKEADKRTWLVNPGIEIPQGATDVHGIKTAHAVEHGMDPALAIADITDTVVGVLRSHLPLIIFNASYDLSLLEAECRRYNIPGPADAPLLGVIDAMVLARGIDKNIRRRFRDPKTGKGYVYKLPDVCERYNVPFDETHDATADATGAALLALAIGRKEPVVGAYAPDALFKLQRTWHNNNQRSFKEWVEREGKQDQYDDIDPGWPLHTRLQAVTV